jgi:Flp pilus assembly protein TadD
MSDAPARRDQLAAAREAWRQGRLIEAEALSRRVLAAEPSNTDALCTLGWSLHAVGRTAEAEHRFARAIAIAPNDPRARNGIGVVLGVLGLLEAALTHFDAAVSLDGGNGELWHNRAVTQLRLARFEGAAESFQRALDLGHAPAAVYHGFALALYRSGRQSDAVALFDRALALEPGNPRTVYFKGECLLAPGEYQQGWNAFEARREFLPERAGTRFSAPEWRGDFPIAGKTLLVYAEQGLGDVLHFCRYIPLLAERANVILTVPASLERLLTSLHGVKTIVTEGEAPPPHDAWIPMMSLPLLFGTTVETIPAAVPYLRADADQTAAWRDYLATLPGRKIGLVWSGRSRQPGIGANHVSHRRSITLGLFAPLAAIPGLSLISLQLGDGVAEARTPPDGMILHDWTGDLEDFADTAALVAALDLVISIDTSVAHLAGAPGKPVWLLSLYDHCWRWLIGRADSPWYPTMRIFQQKAQETGVESCGR